MTATLLHERGLSVGDLAERIGLSPAFTEAIVEDERARGRLELVDGRYRFTTTGWDAVGAALAALGPSTHHAEQPKGERWDC